MNRAAKLITVFVLIAAIAGVAMVKKTRKNTSAPAAVDMSKPSESTSADLPRLVDLGADKCIPCIKMAPILEELKTKYNDKLRVEFIDVWKNPAEADKYKIRVMPTQIFYDSTGKELFRHEGFFAKEEIITKWKEFGVDLGGPE